MLTVISLFFPLDNFTEMSCDLRFLDGSIEIVPTLLSEDDVRTYVLPKRPPQTKVCVQKMSDSSFAVWFEPCLVLEWIPIELLDPQTLNTFPLAIHVLKAYPELIRIDWLVSNPCEEAMQLLFLHVERSQGIESMNRFCLEFSKNPAAVPHFSSHLNWLSLPGLVTQEVRDPFLETYLLTHQSSLTREDWIVWSSKPSFLAYVETHHVVRNDDDLKSFEERVVKGSMSIQECRGLILNWMADPTLSSALRDKLVHYFQSTYDADVDSYIAHMNYYPAWTDLLFDEFPELICVGKLCVNSHPRALAYLATVPVSQLNFHSLSHNPGIYM